MGPGAKFTNLQLLDTKALNAENSEPTSVSRIAVVMTAVLDSESTMQSGRMMCEPHVVHWRLRLSNLSSSSKRTLHRKKGKKRLCKRVCCKKKSLLLKKK